jgi:glycosyltransferase 2 family protein
MSKTFRKWSLGIVIFLVAMLILVPQLSDLSRSVDNLLNAYWPFVILAVGCWMTTFASAAGVYRVISPRRLKFNETLLIQVASGFTNRLIPAGAGAMATSLKYLMAVGYGKVQAGTVVAINNIMGFVASSVVLVMTALFSGFDVLAGFRIEFSLSGRIVAAVLAVTILVVVYAWVTKMPRRFLKLVSKINHQVEASLLNQSKLVASLCLSIAVTVGYGACLYFSAFALNVQISIFQTYLVLAIGVFVASVTPTPGGVGGAEAALVGALTATGVDIHQAVSLALTYRLITYWLPILPGYFAFNIARRRSLL